jgi:hypothetical protein
MPVIINDFQIMVESAPKEQARGGGDEASQTPTPPPKVKPEEITSVACVNRERMERVRAD